MERQSHHDSDPQNEEQEQQFDNSRVILDKVSRCLTEGLMSDVVLVVGESLFHSHRMILCASSDVFRVMMSSSNFAESHQHRISLQEDPECVTFFPQFLQYLYQGIIKLSCESVLPLLVLADKYNVTDLMTLCVTYMEAHIATAAKNNRLVSWIEFTMQHRNSLQYRSLNERGADFICWNFQQFCEWEQFVSMDGEVLTEFLRRDDLVVKDEFSLFKCISKWLMHQLSKHPFVGERSTGTSYIDNESFPDLVKQIMSHIRFRLMSYSELARVLMEPIADHYKYLLIDQVTEAMKFHAIGKEERALEFTRMKADFSSDFSPFTPRLYTDERWSSALVLENYSDLQAFAIKTFVFETATTLFENEVEAEHKFSNKRMRVRESTPVQEWAVYVYPKGVSFEKAKLISPHNPTHRTSTFIPASHNETVRVDVTTSSPQSSSLLFSVGILVHGQQDGLQFVRYVHVRRRYFQGEERVLKIEDLVPFDQLNKTPADDHSPLLVDDERNTLRMRVIITPLQS